MALQEYYNTGDDTQATVVGANWYGQTWTTTSAYSISSIKIKLSRVAGSNPGHTVDVGIYATSAGKPTGAAITSGTAAWDDITVGSPGAFLEVVLTPLALSDATVYAIVVNENGSSFNWRVDNSSPSYGGGTGINSTNSGSSWNIGGWDSMFETYDGGTDITVAPPSLELTVSLLSHTIIIGINATPTPDPVALAVSVLAPSFPGLITISNTEVAIKRLVLAGNNQFWYESI